MRHDEFPIIDKFVHQEINLVLEEIKAEIKALHDSHMINFVSADGAVDTCLEIIDKHMERSRNDNQETD